MRINTLIKRSNFVDDVLSVCNLLLFTSTFPFLQLKMSNLKQTIQTSGENTVYLCTIRFSVIGDKCFIIDVGNRHKQIRFIYVKVLC